MVTHGQLALTRRCVESIRKHTPEGAYELIVVDNASPDGTAEWARGQADIVLLEQKGNVGFPRGCNLGAAAARGDRLLFLNNDTVVTPRWLDNLLQALEHDDRVGAVGPLTNFAAYGQAIPVNYRSMAEMERFADRHNVSSPERWERRLKLIGFCMLLKRSVWERVGPFEERFGIGNYEDDDWSLRAVAAGYRLYLCRDTFIHHEGHGTFRSDRNALAAALHDNAAAFADKWGFHPHIATNVRDDLTRLLDIRGDASRTVLEIGCGCGGALLDLDNKRQGWRLFGLETNERAAKIAAAVAERVWTSAADVTPPDGIGFDAIVWSDPQTPVTPETLGYVAGWLRPGGILAASVPNRLYAEYVKAYLEPVNKLRPDVLLSKKETEERFRQNGFESVEIAPAALDRFDEAAVEKLVALTSKDRKEEFVAIYFLVRAIRSLRTTAARQNAPEERGPAPAEAAVPDSAPPAGDGPRPDAGRRTAELPKAPKSQHDAAFTGERLVIHDSVIRSHPDVYLEHLYRYLLALPYVQGKIVLDAACGTGYGTAMMKDGGALDVAGVDLDPGSIERASRDYVSPGVGFAVADVLSLPFEAGAFDVVVSFETIEHVPDGAAWLAEAARVLKPGGRLLVSTPNREVTNPGRRFGEPVGNPYHSFEYALGEFVGELTNLYDIEELYGQTFVGPSGPVAPDWREIGAVWSEAAVLYPQLPAEVAKYHVPVSVGRMKNARPAYMIAVCRRKGESGA
nr:methyltransferase domain-containing protein [Cohnella sp. REN36]